MPKTNKSQLGIEQTLCPVCNKPTDTGGVLLDKNKGDTIKSRQVTGYALCKEHGEMYEKDLIALIEVSDTSQVEGKTPTDQLLNSRRTGEVAHIHKDMFKGLFNMEVGNQPICFVPIGIIEQLKDHFNNNTKKSSKV